MKAGSRYAPLFEQLQHSGEREVMLSFAEIESLLGTTLPPSARQSKAWWSNRVKGGVQASAWGLAGYYVAALDLAAERVIFRKRHAEDYVQRIGSDIHWDAKIIKALRVHMGLNQMKFAEVLGVRQQTVSEWERGMYTPTRATAKHLSLTARKFGFVHDTPSN